MIVKRNFDFKKVLWSIRFELICTLFISGLVYVSQALNLSQTTIPFSVAAILGSALAIFIAFRNQSSYARWWEARTLWGWNHQ